MKYLLSFLIIELVFFSSHSLANNHFVFLTDCISVNSTLHKSTLEFYNKLDKTTNPQKLQTAVQAYIKVLMESQNLLLKHSKSEDQKIKQVATDLRNLMSDLTKNTYDYLYSVTNSDLTAKELAKQGEDLKGKNEFASGFLREITFGVCAVLVRLNPENAKEPEHQYSVLTRQQRDSVNSQLIQNFGKSITKGIKSKSETPFEFSSKMIYEFVNLEWVFEKE